MTLPSIFNINLQTGTGFVSKTVLAIDKADGTPAAIVAQQAALKAVANAEICNVNRINIDIDTTQL